MKYKVLIGGAVAMLLVFGGCEKKESDHLAQDSVTAPVTEQASEEADRSTQSDRNLEVSKESAKEAAATAGSGREEVPVSAKAEEVVEEVKKRASEIAESVKEEAAAVSAVASENLAKPQENGAETLYKSKCAGCHGAKGEKRALGKSGVIGGQSKEELLQKMNGYKEGTFGGAMKSIMAGQVNSLSREQMEELSEYISKLK